MKETTKYNQMITSFAADFSLALDTDINYADFRELIFSKDEGIINDIDLLSKFDYNLRHGRIRIVEVENDETN